MSTDKVKTGLCYVWPEGDYHDDMHIWKYDESYRMYPERAMNMKGRYGYRPTSTNIITEDVMIICCYDRRSVRVRS